MIMPASEFNLSPDEYEKNRKAVLKVASKELGVTQKALDPHCELIECGLVYINEPEAPYRKMIAWNDEEYLIGDRTKSLDALCCDLVHGKRS